MLTCKSRDFLLFLKNTENISKWKYVDDRSKLSIVYETQLSFNISFNHEVFHEHGFYKNSNDKHFRI